MNQYRPYDSRYLLMAGVGVTAQHGAFTVRAGVNAVHGDGATASTRSSRWATASERTKPHAIATRDPKRTASPRPHAPIHTA